MLPLFKRPQKKADKYIEKLKDLDNKNHQIITWLGNTSIPTIHTQFDAFDIAKDL